MKLITRRTLSGKTEEIVKLAVSYSEQMCPTLVLTKSHEMNEIVSRLSSVIELRGSGIAISHADSIGDICKQVLDSDKKVILLDMNLSSVQSLKILRSISRITGVTIWCTTQLNRRREWYYERD